MAKHGIRANRTPAKPKSEIRAAKSFYEKTHPVGSAERFLDEAAKEALMAAAAGGVITPRQAAVGAAKAVADEAERYPDPLLSEAARLPREELMKRAARAAMHQRAMEAQNAAVRVASAFSSPVGNMVANNAALTADEALGTQQAVEGGDSVSESPESVSESPESVSESPESVSTGPRIVINPTTFENKKDALCVAFNEGFRLWMEATGFEPQSEPTEKQRRFFSDTAYADDEVQLRRTILARIATFDTSVKDPTDDQLSETAGFLNAILESPDWCKNDWERSSVQKLARAVEASVGAEPVEPRPEPVEPRAGEPLEARAALGGGETEEEAMKRLAEQAEVEAKEAAEATAFMEERGMDPSGIVPTMEAAIQAHTEQMQEPAGAKGAPEPVELAEAQQAEAQPAAQQAEAQPVETPPAETQQAEAQTAAQPAETQQAEAPGKADPRMARLTRESKNLSDIWTGGEVGKGRRLTKTEAEFIKNRIDRGASVSAAQRAMFEPARNDQAQQAEAPEQQAEAPEQQAEAPEQQAEAPEQQAEAPEKKPRGGFSDIWSGGEAGKGRRLTNAEADFIRRRIERGASVSAAQRAMFGLS